MVACMYHDERNAGIGKSWVPGGDVILVEEYIIDSDSAVFSGLC